MGRSYNKGEGRKDLSESLRERLAEIRGIANSKEFRDEFGNSGLLATTNDIEALKVLVDNLGLSKQQQKDILENAKSTDEYLLLRTLEILSQEKKGIVKNDADDKKFKFSLVNLVEKWKNGSVELLACYDSKGRFIGITSGSGDTVVGNIPTGGLVGGQSIHIHPTTKTRPLGGSFSPKDIKTMREYGMKKMVVTTREGTFTLEAKDNRGLSKIKDKTINEEYVKLGVLRARAFEKFESDLGGARRSDGRYVDSLSVIQWRDHHESVKKLASEFGLSYSFKPNKGYGFLASKSITVKKIPEVD